MAKEEEEEEGHVTPQPAEEAANLGGAERQLPSRFLIQLFNIKFKSNFQNCTLEPISRKTRVCVCVGGGASSKERRDVVQLQVRPSRERRKKRRRKKHWSKCET